MKFREKSVIIDAVQFTGSNFGEMIAYIGDDKVLGINEGSKRLAISTRKGAVPVSEGEWVIRGTDGDFSLCKPDIFEETYEPAV